MIRSLRMGAVTAFRVPATYARRWDRSALPLPRLLEVACFSAAGKRGDDSSSISSSSDCSRRRSATDQHQLFLEQMNELHAEQRQLFGSLATTTEDSNDLLSIGQQQQQQQSMTMIYNDGGDASSGLLMRNQNRTTNDDDFGRTTSNSTSTSSRTNEDEDEDSMKTTTTIEKTEAVDSLEQMKQDRDRLYGFTDEEHAAWGRRRHDGRPAPQQEPQQEPQQQQEQQRHDASFMEEIARKRQEHFARLDRAMADSLEISSTNHDFDEGSWDDDNIAENSPFLVQQPPAAEYSTTTTTRRSTDTTTVSGLSHVSADGEMLHMVDVGAKPLTTRIATAETIVQFPPSVVLALRHSNNSLPKGPVFSTAITAGIMAAKQTSSLIPLCHPLFLSKVDVQIDWLQCRSAVRVICQCKIAHGATGVEMEALVGSTVAALTIYDMVKAVSHDVVLSQTRLLHKEGGKRHVDIRHQMTK
jgi:cyclic pyranopterin monophosphate synthase